MSREYFKKLNGYYVKDEEARDSLEILNSEAIIDFIAPVNNEDFSDCSVITTKDNKHIIIDLGYDVTCTPLINFLMSKNISTIDYVILSHYHEDHIAGQWAEGLNVLLNTNYFDFSNCTFVLPHGAISYTSAIPSGSLDWVREVETVIIQMLDNKNIPYIKPLQEGYTITLNDTQALKFYNIDRNYFNDYYDYTITYDTDVRDNTRYNNFCMVTLFENVKNNALFTGDIEYPAEVNISKSIKDVSLLKVEHHGLNTFSSNDYLDMLSPKIIVVCNRAFYDSSSDYERDTVANMLLKGALCYDTRTANDYLRFYLNTYDVFSEQEASKLTWSPALNMLAGKQLLNGTDLNDIKEAGVYYAGSGGQFNSLINKPTTLDGIASIGTGAKLIVLKQYHNVGDWITQIFLQLNANNGRMYIRNAVNGDFTNSKWVALIPSQEQYYDNTLVASIIDNKKNLTHDNTWVVKKNSYVTINFDFTVNEDIPASYITLLSFTNVDNFRPLANVEINLTTASGNVYPMYIRYANDEIQIRTRGKAIASGTTLRGNVTYALNRIIY